PRSGREQARDALELEPPADEWGRRGRQPALWKPKLAPLRREPRIVRQDRAVDLLQLRPGLDSDVVEPLPQIPVELERVCLATCTVERPHQQGVRPLAQRLGGHERLELGDELRVAELELCLDSQLEKLEPQLLDVSDLLLRERVVAKILKRVAAEERERL